MAPHTSKAQVKKSMDSYIKTATKAINICRLQIHDGVNYCVSYFAGDEMAKADKSVRLDF